MFELVSKFEPAGDQPQAIEKLVNGINNGEKHQVLLGATGTGKTFTIANVIAKVNKPTLVLAHNKTLAGQLYSELKEIFPENAVEYFVSLMNEVAKEIGMENSNFVTPDGYFDENHYTTVYDMLILTNEAINSFSKPELRKKHSNSSFSRRFLLGCVILIINFCIICFCFL